MKYRIEGKNRICGKLAIQGSKNAALPILAASLLTKKSIINNIPNLIDIDMSIELLEYLGCDIIRKNESIHVTPNALNNYDLPKEMVRALRSSIVFIGAMLGRCGMVKFPYPGGCEIGPRPIDLHLKGIMQLGVEIKEECGFLCCHVKEKLKGATINLAFPSVGATENIMIAASTAEGKTIIENAAKEPEIDDLINFLNRAGAQIRREDDTIIIVGVETLCQVEHEIIPDRIAAITYLSAAAITGGEITLENVCVKQIRDVIRVFEKMGCKIISSDDSIYLAVGNNLHSIDTICAMPYPGIPSSAQPILAALCCATIGSTVLIDTVFEGRFRYIHELNRLGAQTKIDGRMVVIEGPSVLCGSNVVCTDLYGGAAVVITALAAEGITIIDHIYHIKRGYQNFCENLNLLGANIMEII